MLLFNRIRRTGEILTHIHTLKTHGWEVLFCDWLKKTRSQEVSYLSVWLNQFFIVDLGSGFMHNACILYDRHFNLHCQTRKYLDAWCVFFWATTPTLFSLFTFGLFTLMGYQVDAATVSFLLFINILYVLFWVNDILCICWMFLVLHRRIPEYSFYAFSLIVDFSRNMHLLSFFTNLNVQVFTCLALFNTLISPLNSFPWVINGMIDVSFLCSMLLILSCWVLIICI